MRSHSTDLVRVRKVLEPIEDSARDLRWAEERPWRTESHVWDDLGMVTVDLHDLNAGLTKKVLAAVAESAEELAQGGIVFVTGQGRHSIGLPVLRQVVAGSLGRFERDRGWRQRDVGPGRVLLVVNEERIPGRYREGTPLWVVAFFVVFMLALAWTLPPAVGLPLLLVAAWFGWSVARAGRPASEPATAEE